MLRKIIFIAIFALSVAGSAFILCGKCGAQDAAPEAMKAEEPMCYLCGMKLNADSKFTADYEGKTYYFCSKECADMFKKDPAAMIEKMSKAKEEKVK